MSTHVSLRQQGVPVFSLIALTVIKVTEAAFGCSSLYFEFMILLRLRSSVMFSRA